MNRLGQAWKAIVAFLAPGAILVLEPLVTSNDFTRETLTRALVVGALTSLVVYLKSNAASADPTTSTPGPYLGGVVTRHVDAGYALLGSIGVILMVLAIFTAVLALLGLVAVSLVSCLIVGLLGLALLLVDRSV